MAKSIFVSYNFNDRKVSQAVKTMMSAQQSNIDGEIVFVENDVSYNGPLLQLTGKLNRPWKIVTRHYLWLAIHCFLARGLTKKHPKLKRSFNNWYLSAG